MKNQVALSEAIIALGYLKNNRLTENAGLTETEAVKVLNVLRKMRDAKPTMLLTLHNPETEEIEGTLKFNVEDKEDIQHLWDNFTSTNAFGTGISDFIEYVRDQGGYGDLEEVHIDFYQPSPNEGKSLKFYYEVHVAGKDGFSVAFESEVELDHEQRIEQALKLGKINEDDLSYVDYTDELLEIDYNTHFKNLG